MMSLMCSQVSPPLLFACLFVCLFVCFLVYAVKWYEQDHGAVSLEHVDCEPRLTLVVMETTLGLKESFKNSVYMVSMVTD